MTREEWNKKVDHPMQSWEWGEFRRQRQEISRVDDFLIVWTKIKYTPWCFGYVPMGRVPSKIEIETLKDEGRRHRAIGIRLEPDELKKEQKINLPRGRHLFKPKTYWWNLTRTEDDLLKAMHPKGRYNIRIAQKHGVKVKASVSDDDFERYLDLLFGGTTKRQGIYSHSKTYHRQMWSTLKRDIAKLFIARYQGKVIAADLIFCFKDKLYYAYAASALEHKEVMAPTLLLWEVAKWGKKNGYRILDLWGAEEGKGFSRFKQQFGADMVELVGSYDIAIKPFVYRLFRVAEKVRWRILRILK